MHAIITLIAGAFGLIGLIGLLVSLVSLVILTAYFLVQTVLKIRGLHTDSPEQIRKEQRALFLCGALVLLTIVCLVITGVVGYTGI
jgi:uncharacterized membrane protein YjgN (DUF898 family)